MAEMMVLARENPSMTSVALTSTPVANSLSTMTQTAIAPVLAPAGVATTTTPAVEKQPRGVKRARKSTEEGGSSDTPVPPAAPSRRAAAKAAPQAVVATVDETAGADDTAAVVSKDCLIVAKSVRTMLKAMPNSMHCGADALPMLNIRVQELLTEAASRASGNSRKTLKACDF